MRSSAPSHVAVFGGAFDPPHLGHVLAALWAKCTTTCDEIWVLPVASHPYGKALRPFAERLELCHLAFASVQGVVVRDDELRNPQGRTFDLLHMLHLTYPATTFSLIGGTDTERDVPNWYRGTELLQITDIIAVPRRGYDDEHPSAIPAISSTLVREHLAAGLDISDVVPAAVATLIRQRGWYTEG